MSEWLVPATGYIVATGVLGVTTKFALRYVRWQEIVVWTAIVYGAIAITLILTERIGLHAGRGALFAGVTALCAAGSLLSAFITLDRAEASKAVPVMAAYPLVTIALGTLVLSERLTLVQALGAVLVVFGVGLLSL